MEITKEMSIIVGAEHHTVAGLIRALSDGDFGVGDEAGKLLRKPNFKISAYRQEIETVIISQRQMGFAENASISAVLNRALRVLMLGLYPSDGAIQMRLQYLTQPRGEQINIGMYPMELWPGALRVFSVERGDEGRRLGAVDCSPHIFFPPHTLWAFQKRSCLMGQRLLGL